MWIIKLKISLFFMSTKDLLFRLSCGIIPFLWLFFLNPVQGQKTVTSSQLFAKVLTNPQLDLYERKMNYLENTSHDLPVVEEVIFRTETDEFRLQRQEYTARLKFNSKAERNAQKQFHQTTITAEKSTKNNILLSHLSEKYELWTSYYFYENEKKIREQELEILKDKFKVIGILAKTTGKYDLADLIRVESNLDELEQDILELELRMNYIIEKVGETIKIYRSISLDFSNFISLETLRKTVMDLISPERTLEAIDTESNINNHPDFNIIQGEINTTLAEIELEKAKQKKILDFVQLKYAGRNENTPYSREWSVGVGIKIPVKNSDILDIRSLELEQLESENELEINKLETKKRIEDRNAKIQILWNQRNLLTRQLAAYQKNYSLEHYAKTGTDLLVLLEIKENELKKKRSLLNIEEDIYFYYLDILELTGKMVEIPFVNYLSEDLKSFNN